MNSSVYVVATMDTKGAELEYVARVLRSTGILVKTVDVGTLSTANAIPDISRDQVLNSATGLMEPASTSGSDRGTAISQMANALRLFLADEFAAGRVDGVLGLGGSGGTSLITTAMRALPIGLPKVMASTVASGNVAPYVDCTDITMMYSVVDIAGLNLVSETILQNAAHAMAGMVTHRQSIKASRPSLGMTMFGVTTPCVDRVRKQLEQQGFDCLVFHATGTGGRAMEQLVASGLISGVLDITTTEVADELVGGVFPCGPHRFEKLLQSQVPLVLSLGALDMVNFGSMDTVPLPFRQRRVHVHNAQVTLMRTNVDENRRIGAWIAEKLNQSTAPLSLMIPEGGLSLLDVPGQPFHDPEADAALFDELSKRLNVTSQRKLIRLPWHVNAPEFADALLEQFLQQLPDSLRRQRSDAF